jgi:hypothetical protein
MPLSKVTKIGAALVATALYFGIAVWAERSYIDPAPKGRLAVLLGRPFYPLGGAAFQGLAMLPGDQSRLEGFADDPAKHDDRRSPFVIYEDHEPLGPAHSTFADISKMGRGHFAHWPSHGFVFSTSDGSDPNNNGRRYWAVIKD